jgi:MoaA/NifB/PqqE/SkfB family radical SAM enzyme
MNEFAEYGKSFCALPWVHTMNRPHGSVLPCCYNTSEIKNERGSPFYLFEASLEEIWNSRDYRDLRKKMLSGEPIPSCSACYEIEEAGGLSFRQISNRWWDTHGKAEVKEAVEESRRADGRVTHDPRSLDLRLGNSCNSGCRSCHPINSTFLGKEWEELRKGEFAEFWNGRYFEWPGYEKLTSVPPWYESESLLARLKEMLPRLKALYLTGGEPLMVKGNHELLRACVEGGLASGIDLMLNTNLTLRSPGFFEAFTHFRQVQLFCSIDGLGPVNEYLRYPSSWKTVDTNLRKILEIPGPVHVTVNVVAQFHNALYLAELLRYVEQVREESGRPLNFNLTVLRDPEWLQLGLLPEAVRKESARRLREFTASSVLYSNDELARTGIDGVLTLLSAGPWKGSESLLGKNARYTALLDQSRASSLETALPELQRMLT